MSPHPTPHGRIKNTPHCVASQIPANAPADLETCKIPQNPSKSWRTSSALWVALQIAIPASHTFRWRVSFKVLKNPSKSWRISPARWVARQVAVPLDTHLRIYSRVSSKVLKNPSKSGNILEIPHSYGSADKSFRFRAPQWPNHTS